MFKCDAATRSQLSAAPSKESWAGIIKTALGPSRRIRCFRDPAANAPDPYVSGTEFRNIGSTGEITIQAGRVTKLGAIGQTSISLAADMTTGSSILRVEGNGRWIEGSLGLTKAAQLARGVAEAAVVNYDFGVRGNFTEKNGLTVTANFSISGALLLPSGTGPVAPALESNAPHRFEVWDWANPAAPIKAGETILEKRDLDFVFEDAKRAAEVGDVAVYQTVTGAMFGPYEFGFTLLVADKSNTEGGTLPLYEVLGSAAYRGNWANYPQSPGFNGAEHVLIPGPFKVIIKNAAGSILGYMEWSDGRAINAVKATYWNETIPLEPNWNIGMMLYWQNTRPKMSTKIHEIYAGIDESQRRPSMGKVQHTVNGVEPLIYGAYQGNSANGMHNIYYVTRWPNKKGHVVPPDPQDPFSVVASQFNRPGASAENGPWSDGYDYQPGSFSTHNWYSGPGGPRFDRAAFPSTLALWITDPTGARLQSNVPWKTMGHAFCKAYLNHSNHQVTNPNTLMLATDNNDLFKNWTYGNTYYDGHFNPSVAKQIDLRAAMRDGESAYNMDKNGQFFWSGWGRDTLHAYGHAGFAAMTINSPAMAVASKWDTFFEEVSSTKDDRANGDFYSPYMVRIQAWRWLNYTLAWKNASTHRLGVSRAQIEEMFVNHLEMVWRSRVKPALVDLSMEEHHRALRDLGTPTHGGQTSGGGLGFYMTGVLVLMKQTGLWAVMMRKGGNVKATLLAQIRNMNKYAAGMLLDTKAHEWSGGGYQYGLDGVTNWYSAPGGKGSANAAPLVAGLWTNDDGSASNDRDVSVHMVANHCYAMRDYFPELTHERNAELCARMDQEYGRVAAYVAAATTNEEKRNRDHVYGYPGILRIKAPTVLGPSE